MSFWRKISPTRAAKDFATEFRRPQPYRWYIVAISLAATFSIFSVMWKEEVRGLPPPPEVFYITSWQDGRSDAEIMKSNIANQKRKDALEAEQKASEERVKEMYRALGRVSGMDVDKIEREAKAENAAEDASKKKAQAPLTGSTPAAEGDAVAPE